MVEASLDGRETGGPSHRSRTRRVSRAQHPQIADALEGSYCEVLVAPFDVRLPRADEPDGDIDTVVQPDLTVVCDPGKIDERGCRGAPDWVVEVVAPATAAYDQTVKARRLGARGGEGMLVRSPHRPDGGGVPARR
jgi:hypothetical protein